MKNFLFFAAKSEVQGTSNIKNLVNFFNLFLLKYLK